MKFEILDFEIKDLKSYDLYENAKICSYDDFLKYNFIIKSEKINEEFFKNNCLLNVLFFDGSLPKREIKDVYLDNEKNSLIVKTNKEDLTFSTMDYHAHHFLIKINKTDVSNIIII